MPIVGQFGSLAGMGSLVLPGGVMESIGTITVGSGGASSITFSDIPGTYQHLQIRWLARSTRASSLTDSVEARANSDTGSNYYFAHILTGNGSSASASAEGTSTRTLLGNASAASATSSVLSGGITDILDYANTSKNKTFRTSYGFDSNGDGRVAIFSGLWMQTSAITSLSLFCGNGNFAQHSTAALYGLRAP